MTYFYDRKTEESMSINPIFSVICNTTRNNIKPYPVGSATWIKRRHSVLSKTMSFSNSFISRSFTVICNPFNILSYVLAPLPFLFVCTCLFSTTMRLLHIVDFGVLLFPQSTIHNTDSNWMLRGGIWKGQHCECSGIRYIEIALF